MQNFFTAEYNLVKLLLFFTQAWENSLGLNLAEAENAQPYNPEELANYIISSPRIIRKIGFIGLGAMGFGMATHLLKSHFSIIGYDV